MISFSTIGNLSMDEVFGFRPFSSVSLNSMQYMEKFKCSVVIYPFNNTSIFGLVINHV